VTRELALTPDEIAEGWIIQKQGGMWVKTLDLSKLTFSIGVSAQWKARAEAAEARVRELEAELAARGEP
jgi:hypothetical protein